MLDLLEDPPPRRGYKTGSYTGSVIEVLSFVEADNERIESDFTRDITTNDELLVEIDAVFAPEASAFPRLVDAICSLG